MSRRGWKVELAIVALALMASLAVVFLVDLSPKVETDFFFSTDDPQLEASSKIEELFPAAPQLFLRHAASDVRSPEHAEEIEQLSLALEGVPGVASVSSLTRGPASAADAFESPFWSRLLVAENPEGGDEDGAATYLVLQLGDTDEDGAPRPPADPGEVVRAVEAAVTESASDGAVDLSGVPYVVELIRRYLARDLATFSLAAVGIFGLLIAILFRSARVLVGMLTACLTSCALTLGALAGLGVPIGLLTANLVTLVFVLTLSHTVFLTARWRRFGHSTREAVRGTFGASFWCMVTTVLGFLSLSFASAKPLRELGTSGIVGTLVALVVAYLVYPPFLSGAAEGVRRARPAERGSWLPGGERPAALIVAVLMVAGAIGLTRANADPSLLSFFRPETELAQGLEIIDRDGGSSPLSVVVRSPEGDRLDTEESVEKLDAAQAALESDPAAGVVLSVAPLLVEAKRRLPSFLSPTDSALVDLLAGPQYGGVALGFMTPDRTQARYFARMREAGRAEPRAAVIDRMTKAVEGAGLEVTLAGGLYELQGALSRLVVRSLAMGLAALLVLFLGIAAFVSRAPRATLAMVACLAVIPVFVLGTMGWLGMPLDIISSPAAQVAIALGVDSMIHLAAAARRARRRGVRPVSAWTEARRAMAAPVSSAALIVAAGFAIFGLSSFPPTQRFGVAVVLGTLGAAAVTLTVLPLLAAGRRS